MCTIKQSDSSKDGQFIHKDFTADSVGEFDSIVASELTSTTGVTWTQPQMDASMHVDETQGYQPDEYLLGYKKFDVRADGTNVNIFKEGDRVAFPTPGIFGHCSDQDYLKFMDNKE